MEIQELVKNFLSSPYPLSELSNSSEGNFYYDYLALFHIILVKKEEKKGFVIPKIRNGIKITRKLKLPHEGVNGKNTWAVVPKDNKISENVTKEIINFFAGQKTINFTDLVTIATLLVLAPRARGTARLSSPRTPPRSPALIRRTRTTRTMSA